RSAARTRRRSPPPTLGGRRRRTAPKRLRAPRVPVRGNARAAAHWHDQNSIPGGREPRRLYRRAEGRGRLDHHGPGHRFDALFAEFDTFLMGRRTFAVAGAMGSAGSGAKTFVF